MIKKTIHFNDETLKDIYKVIDILGIKGYGDIPKALKFSITYLLQALEKDANVLPTLNSTDMELWVSSIKKLRDQQNREEKVKELMNMGNSNTTI